MSWVTFFGQEDGQVSDLARPLVEQWCKDYGVDFLYKEATPRNRLEYGLEVVPTIRFFQPTDHNPREQFEGLQEIDRFVKERRPRL